MGLSLAIISRNSKLYSTKRLVEAARSQGHTVRVLDPLRCYMSIGSDKLCMRYKGKPLTGYDAVIPRIGASVTRYGTAVLRQFEGMGSFTPNTADAIIRARDKLQTHQLLASAGVGMPKTVFGDSPDDTADLLSMLGAAPHVIKLNQGSQGAGVMLTEKLSASKAVIETLRGLQAPFFVQEFIAEAKGADLRCFVIGDQVVASMRRQGPEGEFRSNLHRGGQAVKEEATWEEKRVAVLAAKTLGLLIAGVDIVRSNRGPLVLEVNSTPGLEGIEGACGKWIAEAVVDLAVKAVEQNNEQKSSDTPKKVTRQRAKKDTAAICATEGAIGAAPKTNEPKATKTAKKSSTTNTSKIKG